MKKLIIIHILDISIIIIIGVLFFVLYAIANVPIWAVALISLAFAAVAVFLTWYFYRCPYCKRQIHFSRRWIPYTHCPHCGKKFKDGM